MATIEYRKILLNGYPIQVRVEGGELATKDGRSVAIEEAQHLPPTNPSKIICVHLNYESRVQEFITRLPPAPTYFHKPITALNSHKGDIVRPERCQWLNYEGRSEEHTSELQSQAYLVCRLLLEKKKQEKKQTYDQIK